MTRLHRQLEMVTNDTAKALGRLSHDVKVKDRRHHDITDLAEKHLRIAYGALSGLVDEFREGKKL